MNIRTRVSPIVTLCVAAIAIVAMSVVLSPAGPVAGEASLRANHSPPSRPVGPADMTAASFTPGGPQGFGSRDNSVTWSAAWFKGKLYVGTGRDAACVQTAVEQRYYPKVPLYPPTEPDIQCTPDPTDLPLQAEIWRWTPETKAWDRVYQSPNDVPIPGASGKMTTREAGYRGMTVVTESDGTEALYVGGVSMRILYPDVPAPRILRTTDGTSFTALPQDPGTFLHDMPLPPDPVTQQAQEVIGFRGLYQFQGKLFVLGSVGLAGQGYILEATNPAGGNNNWKLVTYTHPTPDDNFQFVYELTSFNNLLYLGSASKVNPFTVYKTDVSGSPPYTLTPVLTDGGSNPNGSSATVVSMQVFHNQLYIGSDRPAELFRINSDDSWDLIVGTARTATLPGAKPALSGYDVGFNWKYNIHMWRQTVYNDRLYVGTMDDSTIYRNNPNSGIDPSQMGFDLYSSGDGVQWAPITTDGFGDKFNVGVRQLVPTPYGLFVGDDNHYYGLNTWFGVDPANRQLLPVIMTSGLSSLPR